MPRALSWAFVSMHGDRGMPMPSLQRASPALRRPGPRNGSPISDRGGVGCEEEFHSSDPVSEPSSSQGLQRDLSSGDPRRQHTAASLIELQTASPGSSGLWNQSQRRRLNFLPGLEMSRRVVVLRSSAWSLSFRTNQHPSDQTSEFKNASLPRFDPNADRHRGVRPDPRRRAHAASRLSR
jgi:hypothetical protein